MPMKRTATIYLVDDDDAVRHALITLLATSGYMANGFDSAESFLVGADLTKPGVLLLDQRMEGMSGLELQKELTSGRNVLIKASRFMGLDRLVRQIEVAVTKKVQEA